MSKYKIVFDNNMIKVPDIEEKVIRDRGCANEYELVLAARADRDAFLETAKDADAVCAYIPFPAEVLDRLPNCKVIAIQALGTDFCYPDAANERGICVSNLPIYCTEEVATHTCALLLDCVRYISPMDRRLRTGVWDWKARGTMYRLQGRTHGLISFGGIARRTAEMLRGFGLNFQTYDPFLPDEVFEKAGVKRVASMEEIFATSDIVTVHTPLLPGTRHIVGKAQFDAITKPIILVCTSRGGVIDEDALKEAIDAGKVVSAGLDVIEDERTFKSVLRDMEQVTMTPHTAYYSVEAEMDCRRINMENILDVLEDKKLPRNLLNRDIGENARYLQE
jgi:D-3-phosphoglycerate dehydrogenase